MGWVTQPQRFADMPSRFSIIVEAHPCVHPMIIRIDGTRRGDRLVAPTMI
jgi:hypothetical protein